jgi:hypothetical protein
MASFYLPPSDMSLAQAIAAASKGRIIEHPLSRAIEVHGERLVATREMIRSHLAELDIGRERPEALAELELTTWQMLKRNATGNLTETEDALILEGQTEAGEEPRRAGCLAAIAIGFMTLVGVSMLVASQIRSLLAEVHWSELSHQLPGDAHH